MCFEANKLTKMIIIAPQNTYSFYTTRTTHRPAAGGHPLNSYEIFSYKGGVYF